MNDPVLTSLQRQVLELFFSLEESAGFVIAGGAGLVASGLTTRPTQDVDLFGSYVSTGIAIAADAFETACGSRGWAITRIHDSKTFRRLVVQVDDGEVLVDLAVDSPPLGPPTITAVGPVYPPEELAARKILALFDRAAARDFVDVHVLSKKFELDELVDLVTQLDSGFTPALLAEMLLSHRRFADSDFTELGGDAAAVRAFADTWRHNIIGRDPDV